MSMGLMIIGMALFWVMLILLSIWVSKLLFNPELKHPGSTKEDMNPQRVLRERFLRGEINEAQYRLMREDLKVP